MLKSKKARVLVTGGAGYVGCALVDRLLSEGFKVRIFDKFYFGKAAILPFKDDIEIEEGDIRYISKSSFRNVKAVIHLAGLSNDPTAEFNPRANKEINTDASIKLGKLAKKFGAERFIFASSCSIYDRGLDNDGKICTENTPVSPKAAYSTSKFNAETGLLDLADGNFCVTVLRKGTVHGLSNRMRYDLVVNTMIKNLLTNGVIKVFCRGRQWRPIIDVNDVADAYFRSLVAPAFQVNKQIINIAFENFQIKDLALTVQNIIRDKFSIDSKIIFEQDDKRDRSYRVSTEKSGKILKFTPKYSLEQSILTIMKAINKGNFADFNNPQYYNILWMEQFLKDI